MSLSIIGAGLGRTGTLSLKLALEQLGFGTCYHMREVFARLATDVPVWERAASGENVGWDELFAGYRSAIDFPAAAFYRELAAHYPLAKVILTLRPSDRWYQSFSETISRPLQEPLPDHLAEWGRMTRKVILDRIFDGNVQDRAHVIACYERHNEEVKRAIPAERLLVYQVSDGWGSLCKFLEVPDPNGPFPKVNSTAEWLERSSRFKPAAVP